jgi:hypothetical protein
MDWPVFDPKQHLGKESGLPRFGHDPQTFGKEKPSTLAQLFFPQPADFL